MSTIEPTDEQDLAARGVVLFMRDMPGFPVAHHTYLALTFAEREAALLEQVATLTAERDSLLKQRTELEKAWDGADRDADKLAAKCNRLEDDNARHLAAIETLRAVIQPLIEHNMAGGPCDTSGPCDCFLNAMKAQNATADYAKKADDSVVVDDDEHLDLHFGAGCGSLAKKVDEVDEERCTRCKEPYSRDNWCAETGHDRPAHELTNKKASPR